MNLPQRYVYLKNEPAPRMLLEALKLYGIAEIKGPKHNPTILGWARELGIENIYTNDEMAWCALVMSVIVKRSQKPLPFSGYELIRAKSFLKWGNPVPKGEEMLGDILVFFRDGGYHVGLYVAETKGTAGTFFVLGGNQKNAYNIMEISKSRLAGARRYYAIGMPDNVRKIYMGTTGVISENEA